MDEKAVIAQRACWHYDEPAPGPERFINEIFDSYRQQARLLLPSIQRAPTVFVVGGAQSDFTRLNPLLYRLQQQGIGSLTGNLSGHSVASEPGAVAPSLATNLHEALRFHQHIAEHCQTLIGHSLGAAIALKMAALLPTVRTRRRSARHSPQRSDDPMPSWNAIATRSSASSQARCCW